MIEFCDVIIPVFNGEKFISEAISSILNQTYSNLKLTILDNCSIDSTPEISLNAVKQDTRVCYIRNEENIGLINNYNKAISLATANFLLILSSDDYIEPKMLEIGINYFHQHPEINMILFNPKNIDSTGKILRKGRFFNYEKTTGVLTKDDFAKFDFNVSPSCTLYRAPFYTFDPMYSFCFDLELLSRKLNNNAKILFINAPQINYRNHEGQNIHFFNLQTKMHEVLKVYYKYFHKTQHFNQIISKKLHFFIKELIYSENFKPALLYLFISIRLSLKIIKEIYFWKNLILIIKNSLVKQFKLAKKIENQVRKMRFLKKIISLLEA